jgi:hypothetical protein
MDKLYHASFYDFVRSEENVIITARHLLSITTECNIHQVASALRWLINGWSLESAAKLLKLVSREWHPDPCGMIMNFVTADWHVTEFQLDDLNPDENSSSNRNIRWTRITYSSNAESSFVRLVKEIETLDSSSLSRSSRNAQMKLIAILTAGESAEITATFIKSLTFGDNWSPGRVTELVSFLDTVLEWDETYFQTFTQKYLKLHDIADGATQSDEPESKTSASTGKISFEYLSALYKTNLALASYRLALVDFQIALEARGAHIPTIEDANNGNAHYFYIKIK